MIVKKRWKDIRTIDEKLWSAIEPLRAKHRKNVYLASVTLIGGRSFPCTVFLEKDSPDQWSLFHRYGFYRANYKFDDEKMIDAVSIESVTASPYALSSMDIIQKLNEHGHFDDPMDEAKLKLKDGKDYWISKASPGHSHGFFIAVPDGYISKDIIDVEWPEIGYDRKAIKKMCIDAPLYKLCIFQRPNRAE
jgi:hypothetical protein